MCDAEHPLTDRPMDQLSSSLEPPGESVGRVEPLWLCCRPGCGTQCNSSEVCDMALSLCGKQLGRILFGSPTKLSIAHARVTLGLHCHLYARLFFGVE